MHFINYQRTCGGEKLTTDNEDKQKLLKKAKRHAIDAIDYEVKEKKQEALQNYVLAKKALEKYMSTIDKDITSLNIALANYNKKIKSLEESISKKT